VHTPVLQISKEFNAAAECKIKLQELDTLTLAHKKAVLEAAVALKKQELLHLQSLFSEGSYKVEVSALVTEVATTLASDAGIDPYGADGSLTSATWPQWMRDDFNFVGANRNLFPARAVALAYASVQQEISKRMRGLSLKKSVDEDVEMMDSSSRTDNIDTLVNRRFEQLLKEHKLSNNGTRKSARSDLLVTNFPSRRKWQEGQEQAQSLEKILFKKAQASPADRSGQQSWREEGQGRKKKRERAEETDKQVKTLERAWSGASASGALVSTLSSRDRVVISTDDACLFVSEHSELFYGVFSTARTQFVMSHTPVALLEPGHRFDSGIFMGEGISIPRNIEWQLALNLKFILHHSPNPLRVSQAWNHLERSVRIAWHFRHASRPQSKFYVAKPTWMPPAEQWNAAIERGLMKGKDLLFERTAALTLTNGHRSNPDLRQLKSFLDVNQIILKITDKNLGIAALSKAWY
jgi:hypothetical protein